MPFFFVLSFLGRLIVSRAIQLPEAAAAAAAAADVDDDDDDVGLNVLGCQADIIIKDKLPEADDDDDDDDVDDDDAVDDDVGLNVLGCQADIIIRDKLPEAVRCDILSWRGNDEDLPVSRTV